MCVCRHSWVLQPGPAAAHGHSSRPGCCLPALQSAVRTCVSLPWCAGRSPWCAGRPPWCAGRP